MEFVFKVFYFILQMFSFLQKTWRKREISTPEEDLREKIIAGLNLEGSPESKSMADVIRNSSINELPDVIEKAERIVKEKVKARGVEDNEIDNILKKIGIEK